MDRFLDTYFDGGFVRYVLAAVIGAAIQRFVMTAGPTTNDAIAFGAMISMCMLVLVLRAVNARYDT